MVKQWNLAECTDLALALARRHGVTGLTVKVNARMAAGTFKVPFYRGSGNEHNYIEDKAKILLAEHLWTGCYVNKRKRYIANREPDPMYRLMVIVHECAHMVNWALNKAVYHKIQAHGLGFKKTFISLMREQGYKLVFEDPLSTKVTMLVSLNTGETHLMNYKWNIDRG